MEKETKAYEIQIDDSFASTKHYLSGIGFKGISGVSHSGHYYIPIEGGALCIRPSHQGGFYWGIVDHIDNLDNPIEFYDCEPIKTLNRLEALVKAMRGE